MRAYAPFSMLLPVLAVLAGCAVGPDYQRPEPPAAAHYLGQAAMDQRQAGPAADRAAWWTGFGDPLLSLYVTQAGTQNLDIAQARARLDQARAALRGANAALLPSVDATGQASRSHLSVETPLGRVLNATPGFDRDGGYYEAGVGASWELDVFGGLRRGKEAAAAAYEASDAGVLATRLAVAAQTADTYVAIRGLQARIEIARQQVATRERLLSTVRLRYEKGVDAELQMHQAEGALSEVQASLPVLQDALDAAMNALDVLLGSPPGTHREALGAEAPIPVPPGIGATGTPADLIRRRPDLLVAERRLAAANARIGVAVAEYYPKFSLGALLGTATTASGHLFDGPANQAQGVLGLRWRLFDFGRVDAEIAVAKGQTAEALAAYRLAVLRASQDVEDAFSSLTKREAQARVLERGVASLARARAASFAAYQGGVVSLIEVLDADGALLRTRDAEAQARTEAARAAIASFRALGGGWDLPQQPAGPVAQALATVQ